MAILENLINLERVILRSHHTFGRGKTVVTTCLDHKENSRLHASILWNGIDWAIIDHSKNGTWVGQTRLLRGEKTSLKVGDVIYFESDKRRGWEVIDLGAPTTMLEALQNGREMIPLRQFHILPD